ncbi:MAG: porin, partial [Gammaproteobacteria bacterium]
MYKQTVFTVVLVLILMSTSPVQAAKFKFENVDGMEIDFWGFSQLTVEQFDREDIPSDTDLGDQDSVEFDADRVRFGAKLKWGKWFGNLHFDANNTTAGRRVGGLASFIRDANAGYKFNNAAIVKIGQFKTPIGMAFNMSGKKLPLPKRTFTDRLTFDRTLGAMLSGNEIGGSGFGYDVFYGNPLGRSGVAGQSSDQVGDEHSYAARIRYDMGQKFHIE